MTPEKKKTKNSKIHWPLNFSKGNVILLNKHGVHVLMKGWHADSWRVAEFMGFPQALMHSLALGQFIGNLRLEFTKKTSIQSWIAILLKPSESIDFED